MAVEYGHSLPTDTTLEAVQVTVVGLSDPVTLTGDLVTDTLGALDNTKETDPNAASSTIPSLLRGLMAYGGSPTAWGVAAAPFTSADQHSAAASVTDAPTAGKKLVIDEIIVSVDTTMSVTFKCETTAAVILGPIYMLANTTIQLKPAARKLATADKKLQVITSVSGNIQVLAGYHSET